MCASAGQRMSVVGCLWVAASVAYVSQIRARPQDKELFPE